MVPNNQSRVLHKLCDIYVMSMYIIYMNCSLKYKKTNFENVEPWIKVYKRKSVHFYGILDKVLKFDS